MSHLDAIRAACSAGTPAPRQTGNTVLNLGVGVAVIVFFLGSATIWTTMGGVRDVVLRGGSASSGSNGAC